MDILERTVETVKKLFMKDGVTIPIVMTLKKNGSSDIIPLHYKNDKEKENTLKFLTLLFVAEEVEEYCLVTEAWMKSFQKANKNKIPVKVAHLP